MNTAEAETGTTCNRCNNTGWVMIKKDEQEFAQKCGCQEEETYLKKSEIANIPPLFLGWKLEGFTPQKGDPSQTKIKQVVQEFIDDYPAVKDNKGLLIQGPVGVGKTRLLCAIASGLIKKIESIDVYYIDWNDLVREMRSGEDHSTRDFFSINQLMIKLISVDLLLFDELGASKLSEWVQDNIYHLFNRRYNNQKLTVCATNYPDKSMDNQETLAQRIGIRIRSRLYEMTKAYKIAGSDYRQDWG